MTNALKFLITITLGVVLISILSGCAAAPVAQDVLDPEPAATVTETYTPEPEYTPPSLDTASTLDEIGLRTLRSEYPSFYVIPDDTIIGLWEGICEAFDNGIDFDTVAMIGLNEGISPTEVSAVIGSAIAIKCPEHADRLEG